MSLRTSSDSDSMPIDSIQQPDAFSFLTKSRLTRLSARALPNHFTSSLRAMSSSQKRENDFWLSVTVSPHR